MKRIRKAKLAFASGLSVVGIVLLTAGPASGDVLGIVTKNSGQRIKGKVRYQPASKVYAVTPAGGNVAIQIPARDVQRIQVKRPVELDAAENLLGAKKYDKAIETLRKIMETHKMLQWDIDAARWLAETYMRSNKGADAVKVCEEIRGYNPRATADGNLARIYWDALLATEEYDRLERALTDIIKEGDRTTVARAQIKRGDIDRQKGDLKKALVDGYLRTIVFFQEVEAVQPEALYKATKCFEELGQHSHAEKMRKRLLASFPRNPYTQKIKSGT